MGMLRDARGKVFAMNRSRVDRGEPAEIAVAVSSAAGFDRPLTHVAIGRPPTIRAADRAEPSRGWPAGTERGEVLRATVLAGITALAVVAFGPPPGDASAHLYRIWLLEQGTVLWDNYWFAGSYPFVTYSATYYVLAALLGNTVVMTLGALVTAGAFAALVTREWGSVAAWPARVFGVLAAGPLITGTGPYGFGLAFALVALVAFQRQRRMGGLVLAALALSFSPLAFFFLVLTLVAVAVSRPVAARTTVSTGIGLCALGLAWVVVGQLFPTSGRYPFLWWTLLIVVAVAGCGLVLALGGPPATRPLAAFFALWLASCLVLFVVPSPMGEIVTRLRYVVFPVILLTVLLGGSRPRWLAALALAGAATYNVVPYIAGVAVRVQGDDDAAQQAYWQPAIDYLTEHQSPNHLVTVVATGAHWEAYHLPRAGIPVLRGWYRQIDLVRNDILYDDDTRPADYVAWLHDNAVSHVVLPDVRLDPHTGDLESRLVREADLDVVLLHEDLTIFAVPEPTGLITGASQATITRLGHQEVTGTVAAPGTYRLGLRWSPYWEVVHGAVTLGEHEDGSLVVEAADGGPFALAIETDSLP
jgi:hypothetical protein